MIKIWIDDERPMPEGYDIWCKTVYGAIAEIAWWLAKGKEVLVSLDHDASDEFKRDGGDYIHILRFYETPEGQSYCSMQMTKLKVHFHSANPVGVKNMRAIVENCPWMEEVRWNQFMSR